MVLPFINIIRPVNLLLVILVQGLIKYTLFGAFDIPFALTPFTFWLLVCATLCIAAAGNVINDIQDVAIDTINKPHKVIVGKSLSEKVAFNYYLVLNLLGVGSGFWAANLVGKPALAIVFIIASALLYWYATSLKSMLLVGNLTVSFLVGLSIFILVLFDIYPVLGLEHRTLYLQLSKVVLGYALAAWYINFIREIVKDIQDINGDKNGGRNTLPIVLGIARTKNLVFVLGFLGFLAILLFSYQQILLSTFLLLYFVMVLGGSLLFFCIKAWDAQKAKHFRTLSILLKIIMLLGTISLAFIKNIW